MNTAIEALETSAGQAGDLMMAAICQIALHDEPNGRTVSALSPSERAILFQTYANQTTDGQWLVDAAVAECERIIAVNGGYTISHREQGQWIWDGKADQDGSTTANLPKEVYEEMPLAAGETRHEFTANDGTRYLIERA